MGKGDLYRKRPCRIWRRWFMPNPKLKDRQQTCGDPVCQREWHRRKCEEWNRKNTDYFRANYLQKKINSVTPPANQLPSFQLNCRLKSGLPLSYVQEVINIQHLVIIEYLGQLLFRRFQEVLKTQVTVITAKIERLPP
jgi:hypothetical protein